MRWLQFLEGLGVVLLCAGATNRIFEERSKRACLVLTLFFPTLVVMSGEILTEATATLLSAVFLYLLVLHLEDPRWITLSGLAATVGLATLFRFNMALCGFIVLWVAIFHTTALPRWRGVAIAVFLPGLMLLPWLLRNRIAFSGAALFSTQSGFAAVSGVLIPQGRALPGDSDKIRDAVGWNLPGDLETNGPARDRLPPEPLINQRCWQAAIRSWRGSGWGLIQLTFKKLSYFWLSTDQLLWTGAFPRMQRVARSTGVLLYWVLLVFALIGLSRLRTWNPFFARMVLLYSSVVTIAHVPFNMNTRYRIPFMDPWIAVLAGAGLVALGERVISNHKATVSPLNEASGVANNNKHPAICMKRTLNMTSTTNSAEAVASPEFAGRGVA